LIAPSQLPERGQLIHLRQRRWLVEGVELAPRLGEATLVHAACVDDDAQGEPVSVLWEHELDARVIEDAGWRRVGEQHFDDPELFAAYARTVRWGCVTATDPSLRSSGTAAAPPVYPQQRNLFADSHHRR
jgi:hypothetical protein